MPGGGLGGVDVPGSPTPTTTPSKGGRLFPIIAGAMNTYAMYQASDWAANKFIEGTGIGESARNSSVRKYFDSMDTRPMPGSAWSFSGVLDELKNAAAESQRFAENQQAELYGNLNIRVSDDRVRVTQSGFNYPSLNVNIDNGRSMAGGN